MSLSYCCLGGFLFRWLTRARASVSAFFIWAYSQRETWGSTPHGFAYCKSSREQRVSSPTGQHLMFSSSHPMSVVTWDCASSFAPTRLSRTPHSHCDSATPRCFPISDVRRVYLVDSFIARDPQYNAHTTSLIPTLSGHTFSGWLANCSYPNGRRPSPSLHLSTRT